MKNIADWFTASKIAYPWRCHRTPYAVWVSEVMLQQTRAEVVIPYFEKWMRLFPNIEILSCAQEREVLHAWEGLGYYSRARNLHRGAKQIVTEYHGKLPATYEELISICGIGPYTAGAILAFGYQKRAPFVDGNIARVIARYTGYQKCVLRGQKDLIATVDRLLPDERAPEVMEGLIELGQQVCKKRPECYRCPLRTDCEAFAQGLQYDLPIRLKKYEVILLKRLVAVVRCQDMWLLRQNPKGEVMADLWEFPYLTVVQNEEIDDLIAHLNLPLQFQRPFPRVTHSFTKYKAMLHPYLFHTDTPTSVKGYHWITTEEITRLPFSSGHKRIFKTATQAALAQNG